jgi:hypothetical protein
MGHYLLRAVLAVTATTGLITKSASADLLVTNNRNHSVLRYDQTTGDFIDVFVAPMSGGLDNPQGLAHGPDGNLYVASFATRNVPRYDGTTGAFMDVFVLPGSGGLGT